MSASRRRPSRHSGSPAAGLPAPDALLDFLGGDPAGLHEIARAFGLSTADEAALRSLLTALERSGRLVRDGAHRYAAAPPLPEIMTVERCGSDPDGNLLVRPVGWEGAAEVPEFRLSADSATEELPHGGRATARLVPLDSGEIEAVLIQSLRAPASRIVGVYRHLREGGVIVPADRRDRSEYRLAAAEEAGLADGELVVATELPARRHVPKRARIVERLGPASGPGAISRMTIAAYDIPTEFPPAVLAEASTARPISADERSDLRALELVTIDGSDARDFDDAVWAEPDEDPMNPGGWHLIVAIADVAWYVAPGSALDREAELRGNSVYFPDRVVPMLPEALSNGLCSLRPGEDRASVAAHLWIDSAGRKRRHRFERAIMRSAARLTYEAAQAARDDWQTAPLSISRERLDALYGVFTALDRWRQARGALALDLLEYRVVLDQERRPMAIVPHQRLDSHKLIEEFMILANVATAEELEARHLPCMYRVHDTPDPEKLAALRDFLDETGIPGLVLAKGQVIRPELFNRLLARAAGTPAAPVINEVVLRAQAQAVYSPDNIGHFGLALPRYAHFTSPIRRYADLLVHRALLTAIGHAKGASSASPGTATQPSADFAAIGEHISGTERRAAAAERDALDRYRASLLGGAIGTVLQGRVTGVAPFGLFVSVAENGADGLVPVSTLPSDYYDHDARRHRLVGRRWSRTFALGDAVTVTLAEVDAIGGRLLFHIREEDAAKDAPGDLRQGRAPPRSRTGHLRRRRTGFRR